MPKFSFTKLVDIDRDQFFAISTDYERFTEILPEYFLELKIVEREGNTTKIFETLRFLGKTVNVTTEHVIENQIDICKNARWTIKAPYLMKI